MFDFCLKMEVNLSTIKILIHNDYFIITQKILKIMLLNHVKLILN
jgi:hypothetical protein